MATGTTQLLQQLRSPVTLLYPVWWWAPFYTGSGELLLQLNLMLCQYVVAMTLACSY